MKSPIFVKVLFSCLLGIPCTETVAQDSPSRIKMTVHSTNIEFESHDGHDMFGRLVLPATAPPRAIVIYVQTAEGATVDMKRPKSRTETFNYYDLYRKKLAKKSIGFFSYEGRGIRMGKQPPRFETIDWKVFNTSTLGNKVEDILSAIDVVRQQEGCETAPIVLLGASEGTLLAAEAASRQPDAIAGLVLYGVLAANMRENFKYIMTGGSFLVYRSQFDTDEDGVISKAEFEEDPKKYRANVFRNAPFSTFDHNADGFFSADEVERLTKPYLDAVDNENFEVLQTWAKSAAAVSVPEDWFKDHFKHEPIWTFLSEVDMPAGCFHGAMDSNTPIAAVKALEKKAVIAGKANMEFHYFQDSGHTLGVEEYFTSGQLPKGHQTIFTFIDRIVD